MSTGVLRQVVIVGGGTAGWLTAGLLAADHMSAREGGLEVTLVESDRTPILGVGEGTWPSLRDTLQRIGLSERDVFLRTEGSFKQGSRFDGWVTGAPGDSYLHPFDAPPGQDDLDVLSLWRAAPEGTPFAEAVCAQALVCQKGLAPKQPGTPEFAAVTNYAYHLDATAFADLLREHCTTRLNVRHVVADVTGVDLAPDGSVRSVRTDRAGDLHADLFVDCSGERAILIGEALSVPRKDVSDILFNDAALALQVPDAGPIASQTNATASAAGWIWDIALQRRRGVGHVYSSRFMDEGAARQVLTGYLEQTAPRSGLSGADARLIRFRSGYRQTPWRGNVVAIGMSQGFVEPLEASAIVMIELSAAFLSDALPPDISGIDAASRRFNERFSYRWERIVDFLKLHYILSRRPNPYWAAHRDPQTWPARLRELIGQWQQMPPSRDDFAQSPEIFTASSYAYVLYGMGFQTRPREILRRKDLPERAARRFMEIRHRAGQFLAGLPANRDLLDQMSRAPMASA